MGPSQIIVLEAHGVLNLSVVDLATDAFPLVANLAQAMNFDSEMTEGQIVSVARAHRSRARSHSQMGEHERTVVAPYLFARFYPI